MIYLLHGDDTSKSRSFILDCQKKSGVEKRIEMILGEFPVLQLVEISNNPDLFGIFPFIVTDITSGSKSDIETLGGLLPKINFKSTLIILADKVLSEKNILYQQIKNCGGHIMEYKKVPDANVFRFVDALFFKNRRMAYLEYEKLLNENASIVDIIGMLEFGLRNCLILNYNSPLAQKMSPYVKSKAERYAKNFSDGKLKELHTFIYNAEKDFKTGGIPKDLAVPIIIEKVLNS